MAKKNRELMISGRGRACSVPLIKIKKKAVFITVEGLEGSGKSSVIEFMEKLFKQKKLSVKVFREPGSTSVGEKIRQILLDNKNKELSVHTELLLYLAARTQLIEEKLIKALAKYAVVVCDRFFDSTLVYQGFALGLGEIVNKSVEMFSLGIKPDFTIYLDVAPKQGLARIKNKDRIEERSIVFHQRLRKGYLQLAKNNPKRINVINATVSLDQIFDNVEKIIDEIL
ncbi:MAG: dTMP kinase [Candidatus Omnitrophota bacterium]|nr:dTMP kinase [Candidatus Omnitrophota bacterium]